jgi:hypothetical protein
MIDPSRKGEGKNFLYERAPREGVLRLPLSIPLPPQKMDLSPLLWEEDQKILFKNLRSVFIFCFSYALFSFSRLIFFEPNQAIKIPANFFVR